MHAEWVVEIHSTNQVAIRNIRREAVDQVKKAEKAKQLGKDQVSKRHGEESSIGAPNPFIGGYYCAAFPRLERHVVCFFLFVRAWATIRPHATTFLRFPRPPPNVVEVCVLMLTVSHRPLCHR